MKDLKSLYFNCTYFFGFYCTLAECRSHPHPAEIEWHRKHPFKSKLMCTIRDSKLGGAISLPKGFQFWNKKCTFLSMTSLDSEIDSNSNGIPIHLGRIAALMAEWRGRIADELNLDTHDVASIETKYQSNLKLQL